MNRIARRLGVVSLVLAMSALSTVAVGPADAVAKKCAGKGEYDAIHKGQKQGKVHKILDHQTPVFSTIGGELEQYETCGWTNKLVTIKYEHGVPFLGPVKSKSLKGYQGPSA